MCTAVKIKKEEMKSNRTLQRMCRTANKTWTKATVQKMKKQMRRQKKKRNNTSELTTQQEYDANQVYQIHQRHCLLRYDSKVSLHRATSSTEVRDTLSMVQLLGSYYKINFWPSTRSGPDWTAVGTHSGPEY